MAEGAAPGAGQETEGNAEGNEEGCDEWPEEDYWEEEYGHEAWGAMDENQALEVRASVCAVRMVGIVRGKT